MLARHATPQTVEACCPHCETWQRVDRDEDGAPDLDTTPCNADDCRVRLCPHCPQFVCAGCGLTCCLSHRIEIGAEEFCPVCAALMTAEGKPEND